MSDRTSFNGLAELLAIYSEVTSDRPQFASKLNALELQRGWSWSSTSVCSLRPNRGVVNNSSQLGWKYSLNGTLFGIIWCDDISGEHKQVCSTQTPVARITQTRKWISYQTRVLIPRQAICDYMEQASGSSRKEERP